MTAVSGIAATIEATIAAAALSSIAAAAEAAWPEEACGLLTGRIGDAADRRRIAITRAVESANLADDPTRAFEIDPQLWLDLRSALSGSDDDETVVGLFHSHPAGPAFPSARDLAGAWGDGLVWLIAAVDAGGHAGEPRGFVFHEGGARAGGVFQECGHEGGRFEEIPLRRRG